MFPQAPPLWEKHRNGVVGVSDDPPGETYWKVENGIRLTGMPAYSKVLNQTQMWQVTVLLVNADKALPPAALDILNGIQPAAAGAAALAPAAGPPRQSKNAARQRRRNAIVSVLDVVRKGLGFVLMSMGVSSPTPKKTKPAPQPAPGSKPQP